ncbi:MAG TPA: SpoIIE family protein phosphatase [Bacteroidales bacterium]|nr:SpoIIE family protein phosphatase [Bacteroidales bacterium]
MNDKASAKRLQIFNFKLNALLEITQAINSNLSVQELLDRYQNILRGELKIGRILIFKYKVVWECILDTNVLENNKNKIDVETDLKPFTDICFISSSENPALKAYDIVIPVYNNYVPIAYVLIGDIDEEMEGVSPVIKHLKFIQTISNIIIVAIENIRLFNESLRQEALKKELELASRMQNMLIPKKELLPHTGQLFMTSFYMPHFEVGGDYYDYIRMDENEFGFCIADVSGKGMSAAILMSNFQATLRALFTKEIPLKTLVERLNERVLSNANGEKFITLFIGRYNQKTHELEYINAGHNPPILYDIQAKRLEMLKSGCVGMGMLDRLPFVVRGNIVLSGSSKLLCYTDGLVELLEGENIQIATKVLEEEIANDKSIEENISSIIIKQSITEGNPAIFDDITMLGIQITF